MQVILETRCFKAEEVRMEGEGTPNPKIVGHAAVFNSFSDDLGGFREIIRPGCFTRCLANNPDVRFLINHTGEPLARTKSGTLRLMEDQRGLRFEATLDGSDPDVQRIIPKLKRGDMNNCSFAFSTVKDNWRTEDGGDIRELHDADVHDCSLVTYPAYPAADAALRSLNQWKESQKEILPPVVRDIPLDNLRARLELMEIE